MPLRSFCLAGSLALLSLLHAQEAQPEAWSPLSYPDAEGFKERSELILEGLAGEDLGKWRRGYFSGGDPGKYLPLHAMARLLRNPQDPEPAKYMNDNRSYKEHYHFAAVNWARFWPLFGEEVLTEEIQEKFITQMKRRDYLRAPGTENHKTMTWGSANVLPHFTNSGTNNMSKEATLRQAKEILRNYVKGLYAAGQGEWDSSTYLMFDINSLLNIYDFSPDEESRLLAQAGLDYLIASYALKYTDGIYSAPNQRGYARSPYRSIADQTGYLWWNGSREMTAQDARGFRYTVHPITSGWKPGRVLHNIATRNLKGLPVEQRNSKANYWHGQNIPPKPGASHETVYIHPRFTLGSLWDQHQSQHTRFQLVVSRSNGALQFSGGHPRKSDHTGKKTGTGFRDGTGRFVQSVQSGPVYLCMVRAPEDEEQAYAYFTVPDELAAEEPQSIGLWKVYDVEGIQVALRALEGEITLGTTIPDKKGRSKALLKMPGHHSGFLLWVLEDDTNLEAKLESVELDASAWDRDGLIRVSLPKVATIEATFNPAPQGDNHGNRAAKAVVNGEKIDLSSWPIFSGPFVTQEPGLLNISDGKESYQIDFRGELPVYNMLP